MSGPLTEPIPRLFLESMDASISISLFPVEGSGGNGWIRLPGATGLEMPPVDVVSDPVPGVPGSTVTDVKVLARPVFLPLYCRNGNGQVAYREMLDQIRSLIDPTTGSFRLVGDSIRGQRELIVTYDSGLEGADGEDTEGLSWCKVGLKLTAHDPYAQALEDRRLEYRVTPTVAEPFLGVVGGTDAPWPRAISTSSVIGTGMSVIISSEVPIYPKVELVGPMTSFLGTLDPTLYTDREWSVDIPSGVADNSTLVLITNPRARSIRLDGSLAAGLVALGSTLRPFYPGENTLSVVAPGGTEDTLIALSWRDKFRSLW
jgi:hypothetical protein